MDGVCHPYSSFAEGLLIQFFDSFLTNFKTKYSLGCSQKVKQLMSIE